MKRLILILIMQIQSDRTVPFKEWGSFVAHL
jgi:hypothetical protein